MFYSGIFFNATSHTAGLVTIEKNLQRAKKLYRICDIQLIETLDSFKYLVELLNDIRIDTRYIKKKKVFSQNNRPPKIISSPPVFILGSTSKCDEHVASIREMKFPTEGLIFKNTGHWYKNEPLPLRYGSNYFVNPNEIRDTLHAVLIDDRLHMDPNLKFTSNLQKELQTFSVTPTQMTDLIQALSFSIWFCEWVKQIKRY